MLDADSTLVICGLGNHEQAYQRHRHNVGTMAIHYLENHLFIKQKTKKLSCGVMEADCAPFNKVFLIYPLTYMNTSGPAVARFIKHHNLSTHNLVVIHDDIELEFGALRCKQGGGAAGHNGLRSITQNLDANFTRIRIGVGRPVHPHQSVSDFVLSSFTADEHAVLPDIFHRIYEAIPLLAEKKHATVTYLNTFFSKK